MTFRVGQKVVCVDVSKGFRNMLGEWSDDSNLTVGAVYTIRATGIEDDAPIVWLYEITARYAPRGRRARNEGQDLPYGAFRFRPLIERKSSTDTGFTVLDDIRKRESVDDAAPVKRRQRV